MYVYNVYIIPSSSNPSNVPDINVCVYVCMYTQDDWYRSGYNLVMLVLSLHLYVRSGYGAQFIRLAEHEVCSLSHLIGPFFYVMNILFLQHHFPTL